MAMINCPECGKEISDKAKSCIHCGCPISNEDGIVTESTKAITVVEDSKKSASKKLLISTILSLIASIISIIIFIFFSMGSPGLGTETIKKESNARLTITAESLTEVKYHLTNYILSFADFLCVIFATAFALALLSYLIKNKAKIIFTVLTSVIEVFSSVIIGLFFLSDTSSLFCLAPMFFTPIICYLVSVLFNIIGTKEYFS